MLRVSRQIIVSLLLGLTLSVNSFAAVVADLYSAEVAVADNSEAALTAGAKAALSEVLVKVSGSTDVLQNPVLQSALGNARNLVQQYAYTRQQGNSGELRARFEFDDSIISEMLGKAGAPLWTANRPSVLVWMVIEGPAGRQFLNRESSPEMLSRVTEDFARRGVPVQFPLYDLNDTAMISADEVWRLNAASLSGASQRYGVQHILAGRLAILSNGSWVGDWSYLADNSRIDRSIRVGDPEAFLQAGVSLVAEAMSAKYAVAPSTSASEGVKVLVSGVSNYSDYAGIVVWLEGLELIEVANVEQIRGDTIQLNLVAQADAGQLAAIIELNKRLLPVRSSDSDIQLSYQWQK
ncbi:MAG: DUF2066 domain-containing protein [Proteobacteria bacterium]|nr:DUF2066 domain-containing protein [Pseudomonadota bacterium]